MALVAVHAVVHVALHALVVRIGLGFGVAVRTSKHRIVVGVRVAGRAHAVGVAMVQREPGVIELAVRPLDGVMAGGAGGRETSGNMVRVGGVLIIGLVATVAVGGQVAVVVVDVAIGAGARRHSVRPGEREARLAVVEVGVSPLDGVVADFAGLGEARLHVIRVIRIVEIGQVAGDARRVVQLVIVVDVAI